MPYYGEGDSVTTTAQQQEETAGIAGQVSHLTIRSYWVSGTWPDGVYYFFKTHDHFDCREGGLEGRRSTIRHLRQ